MKRATRTKACSNKANKLKRTAKDPNKPKKPSTAFFVFMEGFRKQCNANNQSVVSIAKAGGEQWKSLTDEEKAPFVATAKKRKEEYELQMLAYDAKLETTPVKPVSCYSLQSDTGGIFWFWLRWC